MNVLRILISCASATVLLVACGGSDPHATADAAGPSASAASHQASVQRGDAGAVKSAPAPDRQTVPVLAGAATTQDAIDRALAAHAAAAIHTQH